MSGHAEASFPRGALYGAGAVLLLTLVLVGLVRLGVVQASPSAEAVRVETGVQPVHSLQLRFEDRADGAVVVRNIADGSVVALVEPGSEDGFIRGVLRGLARERRLKEQGAEAPFRLTLWADNSLSLTDEATGRVIDLGAFGSENRATFAAMLPKDPA